MTFSFFFVSDGLQYSHMPLHTFHTANIGGGEIMAAMKPTGRCEKGRRLVSNCAVSNLFLQGDVWAVPNLTLQKGLSLPFLLQERKMLPERKPSPIF
jgi:hypothetical protein